VLQDTKNEEVKKISTEKESLKNAKEKLDQEKEELVKENENLLSRLRNQQKTGEQLEEAVKKQQSKSGIAHEFICKFLLNHLQDLHYWKEFLEKDRNYKEDPVVSLPSNEDFTKLPKEQQITILISALTSENIRIEKIIEERSKEETLAEKKKIDEKNFNF